MNLKRDLLSITDLSRQEIWQVLNLAAKLKKELKETGKNKLSLHDKNIAMLFDKPSLRTKLSFSVGISQLGGHSIYFGHHEVGLGTRESVSDIARVISGMADVVIARVFFQTDLEKLAAASTIPVINALSDLEHPCQALADFLTIWELKGKLEGLTLAYVGDGENNIAHSLALGCTLLGIHFRCASPEGFRINQEISKKAKQEAMLNGTEFVETDNPSVAAKNADVIYTDTWISMGDEREKEKRLQIFADFQVNKKLMDSAQKNVIFMHDMPVYRGNEVAPEVVDGTQSVIFHQAENRLHAQKALLETLINVF